MSVKGITDAVDKDKKIQELDNEVKRLRAAILLHKKEINSHLDPDYTLYGVLNSK